MLNFPSLRGRNNDVLDQIWCNFSCEGQNGGNNGGNMTYDYGLDHGKLGEHFLVLTKHELNKQKI